jgi:subtilisin family serine protease
MDRIDQRRLPLSRTYTANHDGTGVIAYVIDTGIDVSHAEFEGRAANVFDAFSGDGSDCHGHGTHVAGTIGARTYGVAKRVTLRGVRVLDCSGSGTVSGVIAGLKWVRTHSTGPAVVNLSLGGRPSAALDTAVNDLVSADIFVAVAAGNSDVDACTQSPARARSAYTTAASDAPGVDITSTAPAGATARMSGTSMASPHVAGVAALLESYADLSPQLITASINLMATKGAISGDAHRTPNRLLAKSAL